MEAKAAKQATQDKLEDLKRLRLTNEELRGSIVDRDGRISELSGEKATLEQVSACRCRRREMGVASTYPFALVLLLRSAC